VRLWAEIKNTKSMNPKLIKLLRRIIARDPVIRAFDADNLPQSVLAYVRQVYLFAEGFAEEDYNLLEDLPPLADNLSESIRAGEGSDAARYHLFDDGSLWLKTNAYSSVWSDARDYAVEILLPRGELSRMDAELLVEIGMAEMVDDVRDDFFHAFADVLHRECGIPHSDARGHWDAWTRQAPDSLVEAAELGGRSSGATEGRMFAENSVNA